MKPITRINVIRTFIAFLFTILLMISAGDAIAARKVLYIGDSITKHGPAANLGWFGNWGMAATSIDKDYVHLLFAKISAAQADVPEMFIDAVGGGTVAGKIAVLDTLVAVGADLVIIQLGENDRTLTQEGFENPYDSLVSALKAAAPDVRIYCASSWKQTGQDAMIRAVCSRRGAVFVDISAAAADPANSALAEGHFTDGGVNWHPGDAGMQCYADSFWAAMNRDPNPNLISNPGFTATTGWSFYAYTGGGASAAFTVENGMGTVSVTNGGSDPTYVQLYQQGLYLVPGLTYRVRFKAKASGDRPLTASIHLNSAPWTSYWSQFVSLDASVQTYGEYAFVYNGEESSELRLNFMCGSDNNSVWIDDAEVCHDTLITANERGAAAPHKQVGESLTVFPNPFNPSCRVTFSLPVAQETMGAVYDIHGRFIKTLVRGTLSAGRHSVVWDGTDSHCVKVSAGVYICKMRTGNQVLMTKVVLTK
ncbi:MAG: GDSL-type esterase/lipase family protein [Fibrobacterota bacterium]